MTWGGASVATTTAAVADMTAHASRLLVGGLLIEVSAEEFQRVAASRDNLVVTGTIGSFMTRRRLYLMPVEGITFYCTTDKETRLSVSAIEVPKIDSGPLNL